MIWDLVVVGAGPAGAATALGALTESPGLRVLMLDRADFPRDKACGDGIAPHVLDALRSVGVTRLLDDWVPVRRLDLVHGRSAVSRLVRRPVWVVPRTVFDARLVGAATDAGARLVRHRVRRIDATDDGFLLDDRVRARVVVGADGAHSLVRRAAGLPPVRSVALAIRGYAPTPGTRRGRQILVYGASRQPSYAWSFDRGDGLANVGYGEVLAAGRQPPSRAGLLERLEELLPGATADGSDWRGHHLPLASWRWSHPGGRLLLTGDAAGMINPMSGEGIYYAVASGILAGRTTARSLQAADGAAAGRLYRSAVRELFAGHRRHATTAARLIERHSLVDAALRAGGRDQRTFDDLVEIALGGGRITPRVVRGLLAGLVPVGARRA